MTIDLRVKGRSKVRKESIKKKVVPIIFKKFVKKGKMQRAENFYKKIFVSVKENRGWAYKKLNFFFEKRLEKLKPVINLKLRKVAGILYRLPGPISENLSAKMCATWFVHSVLMRSEKKFILRFLSEIFELEAGKGLTKQKKQSYEKVGLDNKAFIHFLKRK